MVGKSPGSEMLTTLNGLPVTRSWNFGSTWANGDSDLAPYKMAINYNINPVLRGFLIPYQGAGAISASGNGSDVIQDGGRKRKLHLHLDGVSKGLSILLP